MRERLLEGFWLGHLRIEPLTGSVFGNGEPAHLPSRAVEVLLCLAAQPGEIVSRHDLMQAVWGDEQASEEALSHAVSELRHGLGDHAATPEYVQTVPRRGYRLLTEPRTDEADEPAVPDKPSLITELMHRGVVQAAATYLVVGWLLIQVAGETFANIGLPAWSATFVIYTVIGGLPLVLLLTWFLEFSEGRLTIDRGSKVTPRIRSGLERNYPAILAAYAVAAIGVGAYQFTIGIPVSNGTPAALAEEATTTLPVEPNSIAVLRFRNIGDDARARLFSDGLAEDVLDRLARVPGLSVASRTDAWSLAPDAGSREVRRRLRVASYLEGSVRLDEGILRVTVQMIDSATGFHKFSRRFSRRLENFIDVQREITDLTVASLRVALESESQLWLASSYTDTNLDAYVLYRQGREIFDAPLTSDTLQQAIDYFDQALALDPGYAAAHAGLCVAYVEIYSQSSDASQMKAAEQSCAKALIFNPNLYMVYAALGDLYLNTNRTEQAELAYRSALERNQNDVDSMSGLARVYERLNQLDQAELQLQRASRLQPGNWRVINSIGALHFATGRYEEAAESFHQVVFLDPENWQAQGNLGSALLMSGRFADSARALTRAIDIHPEQSSYSNLGIVQYYLGNYDDAVAMYRQALELAPNSNIAWLNLADALHFAGDEDEAREAFQRTAELSTERLAVNPGETESIEALAWASAMLGDHQRASSLIERALSIVPNDPYAHYYDALVHFRNGDESGALDAIEQAIAGGYSKIMLQAEPYLADLQSRKRFAAMTARNEE